MTFGEFKMLGLSRRELLLGSAATGAAFAVGGLAARAANSPDHTLTISPYEHSLLPGTVTRDMMSFAPDGPPPVLRMRRGETTVN
jgi:hypothetical protein